MTTISTTNFFEIRLVSICIAKSTWTKAYFNYLHIFWPSEELLPQTRTHTSWHVAMTGKCEQRCSRLSVAARLIDLSISDRYSYTCFSAWQPLQLCCFVALSQGSSNRRFSCFSRWFWKRHSVYPTLKMLPDCEVDSARWRVFCRRRNDSDPFYMVIIITFFFQ